MKTLQLSVTVLAILFFGGSQTSHAVIDRLAEARSVAHRVVEAHGGMSHWSRLRTLEVHRTHHMFRDEKPFKFSIVGEYASQRIYQDWADPAGEVVWDGERAWSNDWGFAGRFSERFTTSIGFFLANLPWLAVAPETTLLDLSRSTGVLPNDDNEYLVLDIQYEAPPIRKPPGFDGRRDQFGLVIDPETYRVVAVIEKRSHAGQLDYSNAPAEQDHFADVFLIESYAEHAGLLWPGKYSLYTLNGQRYGAGEFFDYAVDVDFPEARMTPRSGEATIRFDTTSTYRRTPDVVAD